MEAVTDRIADLTVCETSHTRIIKNEESIAAAVAYHAVIGLSKIATDAISHAATYTFSVVKSIVR